MKREPALVWRGTRTLIGTMIGVGMLGLPYVVAKVGFILGIALLIVMACVSAIVLRLYADLVLVRNGKARFIHVVGNELSHFGTFVASTVYIASIYGALIAYILFGGQFLRALLFSSIPMSSFAASVWFFLIASFFTIGGSLFVARAQRILIPIFITLLAILVAVAVPHIHIENYLTFMPENIGLPLGVMIFAFFGLSAIPEMRDVFAQKPALLSKGIDRGVIIVATVYIAFIATVIGVTGAYTTENAIIGFGQELGQWAVIIGSGIALLTTLTAYLNLSTALVNTYTFDLKLRFIPSWMLTALIPFIIVLAGVSSIIGVLDVTGGLLGSLTIIMMLVAYERARSSGQLPKQSLRIPQFAVGLLFVIFASAMIGSVVALVSR